VSDLRALLSDGRVHILDGAMGTVLYDRGVFVNVSYDELNLSRPDLVEGIHREYAQAGAEILETNTFGANPVKLSGFGLEARTEEINLAAAELARRAAGEGAGSGAGSPSGNAVLVVGAFGPLGVRIEPWGPTSEEEARGFFRRQVRGLLDGGVDGFLLETFSDLNEVRQAILAIRELSDLPLLAQMTVEEGGVTSYGTEVETLARSLEEWGADAVGLNCSVGPAEILEAVERMAAVTDLPLIAQPNAGLPRTVGDRKMYMASPEYMARYARRMVEAGVRFVGGCCGTSPDHIRQIREAVLPESATTVPTGTSDEPRTDPRAPAPLPGVHTFGSGYPRAKAPGQGDARPLEGGPRPPQTDPRDEADTDAPPDSADGPRPDPVPLEDRSPFGGKLARGEFVTAVELLPPLGWDPGALLHWGRQAREAGADAVTVVESNRGRRRMSSIPAGILLAREGEVEVVVHYTCRDRNMLRMISDLLGAAAAGIRNVLVVSGDLVPTGPYPDHTAIFDIDAIGLANVLDHLNRGRDPGGHVVDPPTRFVVGVALNQGAADGGRERSRLRWKVEAGADFVVTQPVFHGPDLLRFLDEAQGVLDRGNGQRVPVLAGLWPLSSLREAEYLANEVPGVTLPESVLERMASAEAKGEEAARGEGLRILDEVLEVILPKVQGVHVTSSWRDPGVALEVVRSARERRATGAAAAAEEPHAG
jgi:methionine synthase / methylenetetrahydrofolate reductase(NADPH)